LSEYNGVTVITDNAWASNETLELFTDSAGGQNRVWYLFSRKMGAKMLAKRMGRNGHS
jgi:hypothetical protein